MKKFKRFGTAMARRSDFRLVKVAFYGRFSLWGYDWAITRVVNGDRLFTVTDLETGCNLPSYGESPTEAQQIAIEDVGFEAGLNGKTICEFLADKFALIRKKIAEHGVKP